MVVNSTTSFTWLLLWLFVVCSFCIIKSFPLTLNTTELIRGAVEDEGDEEGGVEGAPGVDKEVDDEGAAIERKSYLQKPYIKRILYRRKIKRGPTFTEGMLATPLIDSNPLPPLDFNN